MDKKMMICPDGEFCDRACVEKSWLPHERNSDCAISEDCPKCIPYVEPSPAKCEHIWEKNSEDGEVYCKKCNYEQEYLKYVELRVCPDCNGTGINPEKFPDARCPCTQPEPMPLIDTEPTCIKCLAKKRGERIDCPRLVYGYCKKHLEAQRDADMAWHLEKVQQVRKAFAEECIKGLLLTCEDFGVSGKAYNAIAKSIRTAAEKE
jgi:hypothetical protein